MIFVAVGDDTAGALAVTVTVKVCGELVSTPPLAVPPLSWAVTVTVTVPGTPMGVNVSVPSDAIAGCAVKSALFGFDRLKLTVCPLSFAGPAEMFVAKPAVVFGPEFPATLSLGAPSDV